MTLNQAEKWLKKLAGSAEGIISNPSGVGEIWGQLEGKLKEMPVIGETLTNVPVMIDMVKAWITKEYTVVSPKVVACLVGAAIYLLKRDDLINDKIPVLGYADDLAVMGLALKMSEPELEAYRKWKEEKKGMVPAADKNEVQH